MSTLPGEAALRATGCLELEEAPSTAPGVALVTQVIGLPTGSDRLVERRGAVPPGGGRVPTPNAHELSVHATIRVREGIILTEPELDVQVEIEPPSN